MYQVNEIFYSLQGEGYNTGRAAVFVRFAGCNLRCPFCDTDFAHGEAMSAEQIAERVFGYSTQPETLIVLTGGEPSLQVDEALVGMLQSHGQNVAIETNGTHPIPQSINWVTVSPKAGSTIVLTKADEVKVVLTPETRSQLETWRQTIEAGYYYLQPCWSSQIKQINRNARGNEYANTDETVAYVLEHPEWRLSVQVHKYLNIR